MYGLMPNEKHQKCVKMNNTNFLDFCSRKIVSWQIKHNFIYELLHHIQQKFDYVVFYNIQLFIGSKMEIDPFQPFLLFLCPFPPNYFVKHKEKEAQLDDAN